MTKDEADRLTEGDRVKSRQLNSIPPMTCGTSAETNSRDKRVGHSASGVDLLLTLTDVLSIMGD
jgi:hypothetical protein